MHERKRLHPKKFDSWEMMTSALAFSWETNQPRVNRLLTTPVLLQDWLWTGHQSFPTANFSDFLPDSSFYGCLTQVGKSWGGGNWDSTSQFLRSVRELSNTIRPIKSTFLKIEN